MADSNCIAANPNWHIDCGRARRIVFPGTGPVMVVCDDCLAVASVADTYASKYDALRGAVAIAEHRIDYGIPSHEEEATA